MANRALAVKLLAFILIVIPMFAACSTGGGDDDETAQSTATVTEAAAPQATDIIEPTATEAPTQTPTLTPTEEPTATPEPTATSTSTPEPTSTPTPTATPSPTPIPQVQNPFAGIAQPDAVLDNFTLTYTGKFSGNTDVGNGTIKIFIEQSSTNSYHLSTDGSEGADLESVEIWVVSGTTYFRGPEGSITQIPGAVDSNLFSPGAYLTLAPDITGIGSAFQLGMEMVEGRQATHYQIDAAAISALGYADTATISDPEGKVDIWIDNEQHYIAKMLSNLAWTDDAGMRQETNFDYLVTNVGTTPEIQPPV